MCVISADHAAMGKITRQFCNATLYNVIGAPLFCFELLTLSMTK